jgi:hypothetical protein
MQILGLIWRRCEPLAEKDHSGLTKATVTLYTLGVLGQRRKSSRAWRKSRIAARLLYRKAKGPLSKRDTLLARQLSRDTEVENRLIQQALYYLGGSHKYELDRKLVERQN